MRFLNRFNVRIALSLIGITVGTAVIFTLILIGLTLFVFVPESYRMLAMADVSAWQFDDPIMYNALGIFPDGFSLIINAAGEVIYVHGTTPCKAGDLLTTCAADLSNLPVGERLISVGGEEWTRLVVDIASGERVVTQRGPVIPTLNLGVAVVSGLPAIVAVQTLMTLVIALPLVLLFSFFFIRPTVRRISKVAATSRRFAHGEFDVRVVDHGTDEIGQLGQQFDDMADTIQKNLLALQELAEQNGTLAKQVEATAKQNERLRLSRDLHDTISQRLFSLSMMASTLPELITNNLDSAPKRAQSIAQLAEETQQDLRSLLIDLRPGLILDVGFADAVRQHVQEWGETHRIKTDITLMLHDDAIPAVIQDSLFKIIVEALNNIAKHAKATQTTVTLVLGQQQIALSVVDNGSGFDTVDQASSRLGIYGMRERARAIGGNLQIESSGIGTSVQLTIPL